MQNRGTADETKNDLQSETVDIFKLKKCRESIAAM